MRVLLKKSILSGAAVLLPFLLSGAELFTKVKVELRQESPPEPNLKASGSYGNRQRLINAHWLVFRIEYSPSSPSSHNAWCDDVDMAVRAVIPGPGSKEYTAFTGVTRLWTVRLDGRVHTAVMAIPPQLLDRYVSAAPGATGGGAALGNVVQLASSVFGCGVRLGAIIPDIQGLDKVAGVPPFACATIVGLLLRAAAADSRPSFMDSFTGIFKGIFRK